MYGYQVGNFSFTDQFHLMAGFKNGIQARDFAVRESQNGILIRVVFDNGEWWDYDNGEFIEHGFDHYETRK